MPLRTNIVGLAIVAALLAPGATRADVPYRQVHAFEGAPGGLQPGPVIGHQTSADPATWALYGATGTGGPTNQFGCYDLGCGIVYRLNPPAPGSTHWTESRLYLFRSGSDGQFPTGSLTFDAAGAIYGTTTYTSQTAAGWGTVYKLTPPVGGQYFWNKQVLYYFKYLQDGGTPQSGVIVGTDGAVYGTAPISRPGRGVVFRLTPPASGQGLWTQTTLHTFGDADPEPTRGLVADSAGALYGTTAYGVFRLTPPKPGQTEWGYTVLHDFAADAVGSAGTSGTIIRDASGTLYGSLARGGSAGAGAVFSLAPPAFGQGAWTQRILYTFHGEGDGFSPGSLALFDGVLYGVTNSRSLNGGDSGEVVFKLTPPAAGTTAWTETSLYAFGKDYNNNLYDFPTAAFVRDPSGTLYNSTQVNRINFNPAPDVVYKILPQR